MAMDKTTKAEQEAEGKRSRTTAQALGALVPAVLVAVAVGVTVAGYSPLEFDPSDYEAEASQQADLEVLDAEEEGEGSEEEALAAVESLASGELRDGVYRGRGYGYKSWIVVEVTIEDGEIVSIEVVSSGDDESYFNRAKAVIQRVLLSQSVDVDTVSGATYSSNGILEAIANALAKAQGGSASSSSAKASAASSSSSASSKPASTSGVDVGESTYVDGTYTGRAYGYKSWIKVAVTIEGGKIKTIVVISEGDDEAYFDKATAVIKGVLKKQSTDVDTVSGATYSSKGILAAIENALSKATSATSSKKSSKSSSAGSSKKTAAVSAASVSGLDVSGMTLADGTWTGEGDGYSASVNGGCPIEVAVTVEDGKIASVEVTYSEEDDSYFDMALAVIDSVLSSQSTDVDTVSGATYSSKGILAAIEEALEKSAAAASGSSSGGSSGGSVSDDGADGSDDDAEDAGSSDASDSSDDGEDGGDDEDVSSTLYADGTYTAYTLCGEGASDFDAYYLVLTVTVEDGEVVDVGEVYGTMDIEGAEALDGEWDEDNEKYIEYAVEGRTYRKVFYTGVPDQLLADPDADEIDTVAGATYSSNAIFSAYKAALEAAAIVEEEASSEGDGDDDGASAEDALAQVRAAAEGLMSAVEAKLGGD